MSGPESSQKWQLLLGLGAQMELRTVNCIKLGLSPLRNFKLQPRSHFRDTWSQSESWLVTQSRPLIGQFCRDLSSDWLMQNLWAPGFHVAQICSCLQTVTTGKVNILGFYPSFKSCLNNKKSNPCYWGRTSELKRFKTSEYKGATDGNNRADEVIGRQLT